MKQRMMVLLFMLVGMSAPAYAQLPGININLGARAGAFMPMSALVDDALGEVKLKSGLGIGAHIELDLPLSPINVRANVEAALGAKVEEDGVETGDEVDVIALTGDLVFRPLPRIVVVQPYFLAGAGIKKYSAEGAVEDENDFTGHIGAGVDFKLGPLAVLVEANDYISSFKVGDAGESKLQNDVFVAVGFRIGML